MKTLLIALLVSLGGFGSGTAFAAGTLDGQLWFANNGGPSDAITGHVNSDGSNVTQEGNQTPNQAKAVAVDTAVGFYFSLRGLFLESRSVSNPAVVVDSVQIGNDLNTPSTTDDDVINAVAVDPFTKTIYVGLWGQNTAHTGIVKVAYTAAGALDHNANYGSGGVYANTQQFLITNANTSGKFTDARDFAIDFTNHKLYWTDDDNQYSIAPFVATNNISVVTYNAPTPSTTVVQLTTAAQFPTNQSNGIIGPMAVDVAKGLIYFETNHIGNSTGTLWYVSTAGGTATALGLPAGTTVGFGDIPQGGISIDPQSQYIFITVQSGTAFAGPDQILQGVLSADGHSVTSFINTYSLATLDGHAPAANAHVADTWFDQLPVLSGLSGTITHAGEQGASITLLTALPTVTDTDGDHLAGASVTISAGTFTSNETSANDDHLTVNHSVTSGKFTGTNIGGTYDSANEILTLSGYDTIANYALILSQVQYNTTGDNPTNYGINSTRTLRWVVSDGARNVPFGAQNSGSTTLTIDAVNDAPVSHLPGAQMVNEDTNLSVTSLSVSDVDANPATQSMTTTLAVSNGTLTVLSAGGAVVGGSGTATVTLTGTSTQINTTLAAGSNIVYKGVPNYFGSDTLVVTTNDGGNTGSGGALQDVDNVGITVVPVNDPPTLPPISDPAAILEDAAKQTVNLSGITSGPANESSQTLTVTATSSNTAIIPSPTVTYTSPNTTGTLSYTPVANANGSVTITVTVMDNGGTTTGGLDTLQRTFNVAVTAVNDAPSFTASNPPAVLANSGAHSITNWATFSPGPANESGQTVVAYTVSNVSNTGLFSAGPSVATNGTLSYTSTANANGTSTFDVKVQDNGGTANGGVDTSGTQTFTITVNQPPAITSANATTFTVGTAGTFTVIATGFPAPTLAETGTLPNGVTFNTTTNVLVGTPAGGTGGSYPITFTASNGAGSNAVQSFTLTVNQAPAITSVNTTAFTAGTAGNFNVTATGFPSPAINLTSGTLPGGVNFGTGTLAGTPTVFGTFPLQFTASNGVGSNATQNFSLVVNPSASAVKNGGKVQADPSGGYQIHFLGNPGVQYTVQYSPSLITPNWQTLELKVADPQGMFFSIDTPPAGTSIRFYRAIIP